MSSLKSKTVFYFCILVHIIYPMNDECLKQFQKEKFCIWVSFVGSLRCETWAFGIASMEEQFEGISAGQVDNNMPVFNV